MRVVAERETTNLCVPHLLLHFLILLLLLLLFLLLSLSFLFVFSPRIYTRVYASLCFSLSLFLYLSLFLPSALFLRRTPFDSLASQPSTLSPFSVPLSFFRSPFPLPPYTPYLRASPSPSSSSVPCLLVRCLPLSV